MHMSICVWEGQVETEEMESWNGKGEVEHSKVDGHVLCSYHSVTVSCRSIVGPPPPGI